MRRAARPWHRSAWLAPLLGAALLVGCGSSSSPDSTPSGERVQPVSADGESPAQARQHAEGAASEFLDALQARDAETFCLASLPEVQRANFTDVGAPAGDCEERAEAMFAARPRDDRAPTWDALSQAEVGAVKLECTSAGRCARAIVTIFNLPLPEGGTTAAPVPISFAGGRWRLGHYWVEVDSEPPASARRDPVAAAQGFLNALGEQDPTAFCELTSPEAQEATFSSNGDPAGTSCEERATAMFRAPIEEGSEPLWVRESRALLGPINLHCIPGTEHCRTARIKVESLSLAGGGTSIALVTLTFDGGRWRIGAVEPAPLGGAGKGADQT